MDIKISVIVPVYNVEPYLKRSMDSLIKQTFKDIEIIVINDCSTDNSISVLKEYADKDSRVKLIDLKANSGAAVARNRGLEIAKGEYLSFVDPDDEIDLNFYEELYKKAKETDAEVVKGNKKTVELDGRIIYSHMNESIKKNGNLYFCSEWQSAIYKSSLIFDNNINFPPELIKAQDVAFLLNAMLKTTKPIEFVNNVYYTLYCREGSLNANRIPLKSIKSAIESTIYQCKYLNESDLYNKDKETYLDLYIKRIYSILVLTMFQNPDFECKRICADGIIKIFNMCCDKKEFKKKFFYKKFLKYIISGDINEFAGILDKYKTQDSICIRNNFLENIFSIKNSYSKTHKIITIFGLRLKLKL